MTGRSVAARADIAPFHVMEVMRAAGERAAAGGDVLHLEVGQPATPPPRPALAAARRALEEGRLGYTEALGDPQLRRRIARWYGERHDLDLDPSRVVVTTGASGACVLAFLACFDLGARVAVAAPGYPCYRHVLRAFGCRPVEVPVDDRTRFQPTPALLGAAGPLDGVVIASPSNPTGTVLDDAELAAIAGHCAEVGAHLVVDETYHGITYGRACPTVLAHDDDAVVVGSFSKYFSMTGWRIGWLVLPTPLVGPVERLAQNLTVAPPTLGQIAAAAAMDAVDELDAHVARYATTRDVLVDGLARCGLDRIAPADGAFYLWADVSELTDDSEALCERWLDELGVATTPGIDFDPDRGRRAVRFSFAGDADEVAEAAQRLVSWASDH